MGKIVLITGGTMGIGLGLAKAFMSQRFTVAVCGRSQGPLDQFSRRYPDALAIAADVTRADDRAAMLDAVAARFGRLDILVNNAGSLIERDFANDTDPVEGLEQEVALNLTAPIRLTAEVLARWPSIATLVFVTSGFALVSPKRAPTYGAVKAGLHGFAEGLRRQLAANGTDVLELLPPATDTPSTAHNPRKKMTTEEVAAVTLKALARHKAVALPGQMRMLPTLLRIAPKTAARMVAGM